MNYSCSYNGRETLLILSTICTNGTDITSVECVKITNHATLVLRYFQGVWFLIVFLFGAIGNLTTLISIPFAARKKLYGLDQNFKTTTIFILHLSFVDFVRSILYTFPTGCAMLVQKWPFGEFCCKLCGYASTLTLLAEVMAVNLIAISRCLDLSMKEKWMDWSHIRINSLILITFAWIPGILLVIPSITDYKVGWMCNYGACEWFYEDENWLWVYNIIIISSILIMIISYVVIWKTARTSSLSLKKLGSLSSQPHIQKNSITHDPIRIM